MRSMGAAVSRWVWAEGGLQEESVVGGADFDEGGAVGLELGGELVPGGLLRGKEEVEAGGAR